MARRQGIYWLLTIPTMASTPIYRPESVGSGDNSVRCGRVSSLAGLLGARQEGFSSHNHRHLWHGVACRDLPKRSGHQYVWKEDTRVANTQFELGVRPIKRNDPHDWDLIWEMAVAGDLGAIRLKFEFKVIGLCEQSVLTLQSRLEWSELAKFTGVELGLESHGELGKRQAWTLMLKIQTRSFGVGTVARELLSSMNFEEESMCLTSSDGLTVIQSTWKSKAVPVLWQPQRSG